MTTQKEILELIRRDEKRLDALVTEFIKHGIEIGWKERSKLDTKDCCSKPDCPCYQRDADESLEKVMKIIDDKIGAHRYLRDTYNENEKGHQRHHNIVREFQELKQIIKEEMNRE